MFMATPTTSAPDLGAPMLSPDAPRPHVAAAVGSSPNGVAYESSVLLPQSQPPLHAHHATFMTPSSTAPAATATPASGPTPASSGSRSVKRPRPVKSCTECRKRKLKCDRNLPCAQCQKSQRNCKYAAEHDSSALSDGSDGETGDTQRAPKRNCFPPAQSSSGGPPNLGHSLPSSHSVDTAGSASVEVLASRVDRLEQHVRIKSPASADAAAALRLSLHPNMIRGLTVKAGAERTRFFGQGSVRVLLNLFDEAKNFLIDYYKSDELRDLMNTLSKLHTTILDESKKRMTPIPVYVTSANPVQNRVRHLLSLVPRDVCDRLLSSYIHTTETIYRIIHIPTFMKQYEMYWEGKTENDAFLYQLLLILAVGSRFETRAKGLDPSIADGVHIPTACELVRSWLYGLKGKYLVDVATLQTEVLLIHTQRMTSVNPQEIWTQIGSLVRTAMTMGLHRDPSEFEHQIPPFAGEMRRRLWFTCVEIDLHMSLICNLRCVLEEEDFTCQPPRNLDDAELTQDMEELPPSRPIDQYTDNQIQCYASRTIGTRLTVVHTVSRIESIRDFSEVLELGAKLERFSEDISLLFPRDSSLSDSDQSRQWRCRVILDMHVRRPLLALYRPFALGATNPPPQISQAYLRSSLTILGYLDELDPRLVHFQNVSDMYHQVLKKDLLQAALSLCYYIRASVHSDPNLVAAMGNAMTLSPLSFDEGGGGKPGSPPLYSSSRLIRTVEKSMDLLMRNVGGGDIKDIIALAIVFASVQTTSPEQRLQDIQRSLTVVLETCMRATQTSQEMVMMTPPAGQPPGSLPGPGDPTDPYAQARQPPPVFQMPPTGPAGGDKAGWKMWEGWDLTDEWASD